ncbi:cytoplasmic protein, partial [Bacillus wiedmannii]|uniref:cytoplasmic protein n=1 Tax=Bacillus wiedmannii TaxID=1890302 RepID=UPI001F0B626A
MKTSMEAVNQAMPMPGMDAMVNLFIVMRQKLQEKLEHLYEFNYTSSSNYDTALQLAASIAQGLAEVQSGKGFSPASGTFSTQGLNMKWTTSIQAITEERARQAAISIEKGEMCGKLPEKSTGEKIWDGIVDGTGQAVSDTIDGIKALGEWETWENMGNAALHPIDTLSTMYNALSDSFINDVINGDAESRAKWGSYALTQIGLGLIGDKGLSKVSKVATTANLTKGMSRVTNSAKYRNAINVLNNFNLNIGNRFAYAGIGGSSLKSSFIDTYQTAKDKLSPYQYTKRTTDGDIFVGKLYGEDVILKDVKVDEITYSKRTREEAEQLRKEFDRSVRKDFLNALVNDPVKLKELKKAGITDADIERMKRGNNPKGWQVHHNLPLDDGGTNDFGNLTLIQNHPYHKAITNTQRTLTRHLQEGDSVDVSWPIPKHNIYPKGE